MRHAIAVLCTLFIGSVGLAAQNQGSAGSFGIAQMEGLRPSGTLNITVIQSANSANGCPVSLRAQHLADGGLVWARSSEAQKDTHNGETGQWLHVTMADPQSRQVTTATVTIHGLSNKARVTQALSNGQDASDAQWTTTLSFARAEGITESANLRVPGMTSVQTIELKSVTYADGSSWRPSSSQSCRVTPDPLMLVSRR